MRFFEKKKKKKGEKFIKCQHVSRWAQRPHFLTVSTV